MRRHSLPNLQGSEGAGEQQDFGWQRDSFNRPSVRNARISCLDISMHLYHLLNSSNTLNFRKLRNDIAHIQRKHRSWLGQNTPTRPNTVLRIRQSCT